MEAGAGELSVWSLDVVVGIAEWAGECGASPAGEEAAAIRPMPCSSQGAWSHGSPVSAFLADRLLLIVAEQARQLSRAGDAFTVTER